MPFHAIHNSLNNYDFPDHFNSYYLQYRTITVFENLKTILMNPYAN